MPYGGTTHEQDKHIEKCVSEMHGNNKKTGKPYTASEKIAICKHNIMKESEPSFSVTMPLLEAKSDDVYRFVLSTTTTDLGNDTITQACIEDMNNQLKSGLNGYTVTAKGSLNHDVIKLKDFSIPPVSRVVNSFIDGNKLIADVKLNKVHPDYDKTKYQIDEKFMDGVSIEYLPDKPRVFQKDGKTCRTIEKMRLTGYAHTPRPMNLEATLIEQVGKSLDMMETIEQFDQDFEIIVKPKGGETMTEEIKTEAVTEVKTAETAEIKTQPPAEIQIKAEDLELLKTEIKTLKEQLIQKKSLEDAEAKIFSDKKVEIREILKAAVAEMKSEKGLINAAPLDNVEKKELVSLSDVMFGKITGGTSK